MGVPARLDDVPNSYVKASTEPDLAFVLSFMQEIKHLGIASKFLGTRFTQLPSTGYEIDQSAIFDELLLKFGLQDASSL